MTVFHGHCGAHNVAGIQKQALGLYKPPSSEELRSLAKKGSLFGLLFRTTTAGAGAGESLLASFGGDLLVGCTRALTISNPM